MSEVDLKTTRRPVHEANKIRLARDIYKGSFLIVEGRSDKKVLQNFVNSSQCKIIIPPEKEDAKNFVIEVLSILNKDEQVSGVLGIVDSDFWKIEGYSSEIENLLTTDNTDLENMIINSPALDRVLQETGSEEKIKVFVHKNGSLRDFLFVQASIIGYFRWLNRTKELSLKFNGIDFKKFVDKDTLNVSLTELIKVVISNNNSGRVGYNEDEMLREIKCLYNETHDRKNLSRGHDLVSLLAYGLRRIWGTNDAQKVSEEIINAMLRLAYDTCFFLETDLYDSIIEWESSNSPFQILKREIVQVKTNDSSVALQFQVG